MLDNPPNLERNRLVYAIKFDHNHPLQDPRLIGVHGIVTDNKCAAAGYDRRTFAHAAADPASRPNDT
jgi:hypothetical protein